MDELVSELQRDLGRVGQALVGRARIRRISRDVVLGGCLEDVVRDLRAGLAAEKILDEHPGAQEVVIEEDDVRVVSLVEWVVEACAGASAERERTALRIERLAGKLSRRPRPN
jgi:hypothetical protein